MILVGGIVALYLYDEKKKKDSVVANGPRKSQTRLLNPASVPIINSHSDGVLSMAQDISHSTGNLVAINDHLRTVLESRGFEPVIKTPSLYPNVDQALLLKQVQDTMQYGLAGIHPVDKINMEVVAPNTVNAGYLLNQVKLQKRFNNLMLPPVFQERI
jgi:hypothetical protein